MDNGASSEFINGTKPAEGRLRQLLRDGLVSAILVSHATGQPEPLPALQWAGPRAPMFFDDGTVFKQEPGTDYEEGFWASIYIHEAELKIALAQAAVPQAQGEHPARDSAGQKNPKLDTALEALAALSAAGVDVRNERRDTLLTKVEGWCRANKKPRPGDRTFRTALSQFLSAS